MRCTLGREERISLEVREVATKASEKPEMKHDVPPDMLNALQRAAIEFDRAQAAVRTHLAETGQPEPTWG